LYIEIFLIGLRLTLRVLEPRANDVFNRLAELLAGLPIYAPTPFHGRRDLHRRQQQLLRFVILGERCFETLDRANGSLSDGLLKATLFFSSVRRIFQTAITPPGVRVIAERS
jgi:hypothetical protein